MSRSTLDLLMGLLEAHRYDDADRLVGALHQESGGDETTARLLAAARELCADCRREHERVQEHWQAAADGAAAEAGLRQRLALVLDRVLGNRPDLPRTDGAPGDTANGDTANGDTAYGDTAPTPPLGLAAVPVTSDLAVRCLGPLQVFREHRDLGPLPNRRAKSVFKYLLLHRGRPTPKGVLMDLFWPDATPEAARNNLNVAVYALRRFLGRPEGHHGTVVFHEDGYGLDPGLKIEVDLDAFDTHVRAAAVARTGDDAAGELHHLRAAQHLHRDVLYADDLYEEWVLPYRRQVLDHYVGALERLAARHRLQGDHPARAGVLQAILEVQPAHEEAHRALMRTHVALGRPHLALRQYETCVNALRDELDVAPFPATDALLAALNQRRLSPCP